MSGGYGGGGGSITQESGDSTQVAFFNGATTLDGVAEFTWTDGTKTLLIGPSGILTGSGGLTVRGGSAAGDDLTLQATSHATPGDVVINQDATNTIATFVGASATDDRYLAIGGTTRISGVAKLHIEDSGSSVVAEIQSKVSSGSAYWRAYNNTSDYAEMFAAGSSSYGLQARSVIFSGDPGGSGSFGVGPSDDTILYFLRNNAPRGWCDTSNNWVFGDGNVNPAGTLTAGKAGTATVVAASTSSGTTSHSALIAQAADASHRARLLVTNAAWSDAGLITANDAVLEIDSAIDRFLIHCAGAKEIAIGQNSVEVAKWGTDGNYVAANGYHLLVGGATPETGSTNTLAVKNGTAPDAGVADQVIFYSSDNASGHTIPSFYCEGTDVVATGQADSASSVRVKMRINGTVYTFLCI